MSRVATPEDDAELWRAKELQNSEREAKEFEREKRRDRLEREGWSSGAIRGDGDLNDGLIHAFKDSLHPWGAPDHFSDRKSKRVRKDTVKNGFWYEVGGLPEDAQPVFTNTHDPAVVTDGYQEFPRAELYREGDPLDAQGQAAAGATLVGRGESGPDRPGGQGVRVFYAVPGGPVDSEVVPSSVPEDGAGRVDA